LGEFDDPAKVCTEFAQNPGASADRRVKFPVTIRYRSAKVSIYGKGQGFDYYRFAYRSAGWRHVKTFATYVEARKAAKATAKDLANGSDASTLSASQTRDARAAFEKLDEFFRNTGNRCSLLGAVSGFVEASMKLDKRSLGDAIEGFLSTVVTVQRVTIAEAVEEFIESRKAKAEAKDGKRSALSPVYAPNVAAWLREFAGTFTGTCVCDLGKSHLALVVVDYLGQVRSGERNRNRYEEITLVSGGLKVLAKELKVPLLALAQLNRDNENEERQPRISDLRDSGSIEQDADIVALLHREAEQSGDVESSIFWLTPTRLP